MIIQKQDSSIHPSEIRNRVALIISCIEREENDILNQIILEIGSEKYSQLCYYKWFINSKDMYAYKTCFVIFNEP